MCCERLELSFLNMQRMTGGHVCTLNAQGSACGRRLRDKSRREIGEGLLFEDFKGVCALKRQTVTPRASASSPEPLSWCLRAFMFSRKGTPLDVNIDSPRVSEPDSGFTGIPPSLGDSMPCYSHPEDWIYRQHVLHTSQKQCLGVRFSHCGPARMALWLSVGL